jgi:hypothetical protein
MAVRPYLGEHDFLSTANTKTATKRQQKSMATNKGLTVTG